MAALPFDIPVICPVVIGRADVIDSLDRCIESVRDGRGETVVLAGEAGIGKTRLVAETKARATRLGFAILQGNCFEHDRALPYAPLSDLLRAFIAAHSPDDLGANAHAFAKLVPELGAHFPNPSPALPGEPAQEKHLLFQGLVEFFARLATRAPCLVVIEDLHWSDDATLDLVLFLARRVVAYPILLLITYRHDETSPNLTRLLADLDREHLAREFALPALARADVDAMMRAMLELPGPVRAEFLEAIYALTEGNPFFVEEILKSLIAAGDIFFANGIWDRKPIAELRIPRTVQVAVQNRSARLSESARRALALAAVAGRRFDFALLQELTKMSETELLGAIKELVAEQLIVEESADEFAFRHALTREAVYATLLLRERRRHHQRVAETLERLYADSLDARVADLAYHFYQAQVWNKALDYAHRAGEQAQALYAPSSAVEHFTRALEAATHLAQPLSALYRARGQAYETLGNFDAAQNDYDHALETARAENDRRAEWQSLIDHGFLWAARDYAQTGEYFQRALARAREIGDAAMIAHSLNRMGNWRVNLEDTTEALRYHQEALDIFRQLNDARGVATTLDLLGMATQLNADLVRGVEYYRQVIPLFRDLDDRQGLVSSFATMTLCGATYVHNASVAAANLNELAQFGETALQHARAIGWRAGEAYALVTSSVCLGPLGEFGHALEYGQRAHEIADEIGHAQWKTAAHLALGALHLDLLDAKTARDYLEQTFAFAQELGSPVWIRLAAAYLASACIAQNDLARAQTILDAALKPDAPAQTQGERLLWCARAELALARGDPTTALRVADRLSAGAANLSDGRVIPRVWKLRGDALALLNRRDEAVSVWRAAHIAAREQGARAQVWRIHIALDEFAAARQVIEEIAARISDDALCENFTARALARMPRAQPITPRRAEKAKFSGLTAREREVAALIAHGKSNREIADALVVGERTVETHVGNILTKLNFASRTQVAAWAVEKNLNGENKR